MKVVKLNFFISSFLFGLVANVRSDSSCVNCVPAAFNLATNEQSNALEYVPLIWSHNITLTPLAGQLKKLILDIVKNEKCPETPSYGTMTVLLATLHLTNYISNPEPNRDVCGLAAVINATVAYVKYQDKSCIDDALKRLETGAVNNLKNNIRSSIIRSGCGYGCGEVPPLPPIQKCYKNGFVYPVKQLWSLPGDYSTVPCKLRDLVYRMYDSCHYLDKFLATCVSYGLTEISQTLFSLFDPASGTKILNNRLNKPIEKVCCYSFIKRAEDITKELAEFKKHYEVIKSEEPCCHEGEE